MSAHQLPAQVAHFHLTEEERRACEAEHADLMARFTAAGSEVWT